MSDSGLPKRVVVANGAYWRDYGDYFSMCPVSTDNDPVEPVAVYELVRTTRSKVLPIIDPASGRVKWRWGKAMTGGWWTRYTPLQRVILAVLRAAMSERAKELNRRDL